MSFLLNLLRIVYRTVYGFLLYYLFPRKTIVLIPSVQRSGSTLLKALLAEAPDISHLPEVNLMHSRLNCFDFYYRAYRRSPKRIVVLKRPAGLSARQYLIPTHPGLRFIILYRDMEGWYLSMRKVFQETGQRELDRTMTDERLLDYWCRIYESLLDNKDLLSAPMKVLTYEELIHNPEEVTARLFNFVGSAKRGGVSSYQKPRDFEWAWGSDDAGEKINKLKVIESPPGRAPESWVRLVAGSKRYRDIQIRLDRLREV